MKDHGRALCLAFLTVAIPVTVATAATDTPRDPRAASGPVTASRPATPPMAAPVDPAAQERVLKTFDNWIRAWNAKDVDAYLAHYAKDFQLPSGESRDAWERQRRIRIWNKAYINVQAQVPQVAVKDNRATVKFVQVYLSDRVRDESHKTLVFVKSGARWQIVHESTQR